MSKRISLRKQLENVEIHYVKLISEVLELAITLDAAGKRSKMRKNGRKS